MNPVEACKPRVWRSNNTEHEQNDQEGIDESEYAEIENEYYQSVEWRVYPSGICISPLRSRGDHSSTSPTYQNAILHQNDDYLEVIADAKSLKDEHTAIICDNASAFDESSSSKSSDRSTSSYIQTIIKHSSSETEDLSLEIDVEKRYYNSFSKSTNSETDSAGPSHSTYCLNIQAALRSDEDEFESNISDDNTELCELKPNKESVHESSKYEQLSISQTETHLYNQ
ncbi:Hypothetical predicted protein [Mytilus galloprovincialis]|uniref:Uncharacterized protein n=1 Tax=Mytilus galloprovincialis TaxID=29158 RepID=A0A8B6CGE6_MYTGA|nr:Hypothetical predicted protein [Mytilus galloprovincialis]